MLIIGYLFSACKSQEVAYLNDNLVIGDLRNVPRVGGMRTFHERLIILNINKRQTVFEVTKTNAMALSEIPTNYVERFGVVMNDTGNYDTKYDIIISITLKKKALELLNEELRQKLK